MTAASSRIVAATGVRRNVNLAKGGPNFARKFRPLDSLPKYSDSFHNCPNCHKPNTPAQNAQKVENIVAGGCHPHRPRKIFIGLWPHLRFGPIPHLGWQYIVRVINGMDSSSRG